MGHAIGAHESCEAKLTSKRSECQQLEQELEQNESEHTPSADQGQAAHEDDKAVPTEAKDQEQGAHESDKAVLTADQDPAAHESDKAVSTETKDQEQDDAAYVSSS